MNFAVPIMIALNTSANKSDYVCAGACWGCLMCFCSWITLRMRRPAFRTTFLGTRGLCLQLVKSYYAKLAHSFLAFKLVLLNLFILILLQATTLFSYTKSPGLLKVFIYLFFILILQMNWNYVFWSNSRSSTKWNGLFLQNVHPNQHAMAWHRWDAWRTWWFAGFLIKMPLLSI